jgi:poly-gamma-glutamate system protein
MRKQVFLLVNGCIGIGFILVLALIFDPAARPDPPELRLAAENMERSLKIIQEYCFQNQINTTIPEDPRHTGLIGPEWSEITTTLGDPEAKRTTLNPAFASLIVHLMIEGGVKPGDTVAIGCSGSFPALLIASLSAARAMEVRPLVIISLGSSSFGASNPDFNLWDIYRLLLANGILDTGPVAASMGGEDDLGSGFGKAVSDSLQNSIRQAGIPLISERDLSKNRSAREKYYFDGRPGRIKAFINAGGGYANIGSSPTVLNLKPGLIRHAPVPDPSKQGMIHTMLLHRIPVIHLLFIKGLARKYESPWDPPTMQSISGTEISFNGNRNPAVLVISLLGLLWFAGMLTGYGMLYNRHE